MSERDELEAWAKLYDLGHHSFEENEETREARAELDRQLEEAYERLVQGGSISFRGWLLDRCVGVSNSSVASLEESRVLLPAIVPSMC
jgi:hypothetical protein